MKTAPAGIVQAVVARRDRRRVPPPGVMAGGFHVRRMGSGQPAVVFEAGIAASSSNWSVVQSTVAAFGATVSYDRRGVGWTAPSREPLSLHAMTNDLHRLVRAIDLPRPFVLAAHSFGSYVARVYAHRFRDDVLALVLIDPVTPEEWMTPVFSRRWRLVRAAFFAYLGAGAAAAGLVRLGLWGVLRRGRGDAGPLLGMSSTMRRIAQEVAKLPADEVSGLRSRWSRPGFFLTIARYVRALPRCAAEAARHPIPQDVPVTLVSSGRLSPEVLSAHRAMATRHVVAGRSGHWIHLDQPELVVDEIRRAAGGAHDASPRVRSDE